MVDRKCPLFYVGAHIRHKCIAVLTPTTQRVLAIAQALPVQCALFPRAGGVGSVCECWLKDILALDSFGVEVGVHGMYGVVKEGVAVLDEVEIRRCGVVVQNWSVGRAEGVVEVVGLEGLPGVQKVQGVVVGVGVVSGKLVAVGNESGIQSLYVEGGLMVVVGCASVDESVARVEKWGKG